MIPNLEKIVGAVLSWPTFGLVTIFVCRKKIPALLEKVISVQKTKIGPVDFDFPKPSDQSSATADAVSESPLALSANSVTVISPEIEPLRRNIIDFGKNMPAVQEQEEKTKQTLLSASFELTNGLTEEVLIRSFCYFMVQYEHEKVYRSIFGSQIQLLKLANSRKIKVPEIASLFEQTKVSHPGFFPDTYSAANWAGYLISSGLIQENRTDVLMDTDYSITTMGKSFLVWMVNYSISEAKYG